MKLVSLAWTIIKGVKDVLVLLFMLLFFGLLYAVMAADPNPARNKGGALLLAFDGPIVEQKSEVDPLSFLMGTEEIVTEYRLDDVLRALDAAASDSSIKAVVLDLDRFGGAGHVALQNITDRIDRIKAAKKPVLAFATAYYDQNYTLAAHASEIWLDPMGGALIAGPGGSQPYFKGLIDRFGVNVHVYRAGKFKSFVEPYTLTRQSEEAKTADQTLINVIWTNWSDRIGKARPKAQLSAFVANPLPAAADATLADATLKAGIVDKIGSYGEFSERVAKLVGEDSESPEGFNASLISDYIEANPAPAYGDAIGIVHVSGAIVDGEGFGGSAGGYTISTLITDAVNKKSVKAIVLRVDSPGGSAFASEQIRLALADAKAAGIPVVVSMGNVAASGGYWVALAGDRIFAEPSTITGSIGVFGVIPSFEKTLAGYGITSDGVKTTPYSGQIDIIGGITPETDRVMQVGVDNVYARFLSLVASARKLPPAKVSEIAQGRVWDGGTARQLGLIDGFGSLDDAVADAAKRAGIASDNVKRVTLSPTGDVFAEWLGGWAQSRIDRSDLFTRLVKRQQTAFVAGMRDAVQVMSGPAIQTRCLACPPAAPTPVTFSFYELIRKQIFND